MNQFKINLYDIILMPKPTQELELSHLIPNSESSKTDCICIYVLSLKL
jgi:hypothetical protein